MEVKKEIKKFLNSFDEFFVFILFFVIIFGFRMYLTTYAGDELWVFQNIYKIYNGYKIYVDANVITTPLYYFIGAYFLKVFGANFFIFKLYSILISSFLFLGIYKLFKCLKIKNIYALFCTLFFLIVELNIMNYGDYNIMAIFFAIMGIIVILNKENYSNKKFIILETICAFLVFFTKQNIGAYYLIGLSIYLLIYENKENKIKNILKIYILFLLLILINLFAFYKNGILNGFISYCVLGIKEFSQKNFKIIFNGYILNFIFLSMINVILVFLINKKKILSKDERNNINIISCFSLPFLLISYPIANKVHNMLSMILVYIILIYFIYILLLNFDLLNNDKVIKFIIRCIIAVFLGSSIAKCCLYFYKINNKYKFEYNNIYYGAIIDEEILKKMDNVTNYIKNSQQKVIVFSIEAGFYNMPLKISNGSFDEPLMGNFGKDGEDGIIEQISKMKNTIFLVKDENKIGQESQKIQNFIKNNLIYDGMIEDFYIYKTKN